MSNHKKGILNRFLSSILALTILLTSAAAVIPPTVRSLAAGEQMGAEAASETVFTPGTATELPPGAEVWDGIPATSLSGGSGTEEDPWLIADAAEFMYFRNELAASADAEDYYRMTGNVYLNSSLYRSAIGVSPNDLGGTVDFAGHLDGAGYAVYNPCSSGDNYSSRALFGTVSGTLKNLTVRGAHFKAINTTCAVFAISLSGTIENCHAVDCTVKGYKVGGIAAGASGQSPTVRACTVSGAVYGGCSRANGYAGGIVGHYGTADGTLRIEACTNYAPLANFNAQATACVLGGILGGAGNDSGLYVEITDCSNYGALSSVYDNGGYVGGIIGRDYRIRTLTVSECINYADILTDGAAGGIVGCSNTLNNLPSFISVSNSLNYGDVTSLGDRVGGVAGSFEDARANLAMTGVANYGNVSGMNHVGGLVGYVRSAQYSPSRVIAADCANYGDVIADGSNAGGAVGYFVCSRYTTDGIDLNHCLLTGNVSALTHAGALVGSTERLLETSVPSATLNGSYLTGNVSVTAVDGMVGTLQGGSTCGGYTLTVTDSAFSLTVLRNGTAVEAPYTYYTTSYETNEDGTETATPVGATVTLTALSPAAVCDGTVRSALNTAATAAGHPLWYQRDEAQEPELVITLAAPAVSMATYDLFTLLFEIPAPLGLAAEDICLSDGTGATYPAQAITADGESTPSKLLFSVPTPANKLSVSHRFRLSVFGEQSLNAHIGSAVDYLAAIYDTVSTDVQSVARVEMIDALLRYAAYAGDANAIPLFCLLTGATPSLSVAWETSPIEATGITGVTAVMNLQEGLTLCISVSGDVTLTVPNRTVTSLGGGLYRIEGLCADDLNTPLTLVYSNGTTVGGYTVGTALNSIIESGTEAEAALAGAAALYMASVAEYEAAKLYMENEGPHTWSEGSVTTAPTCTLTGVMTYVCVGCHMTRHEVIPATGVHTPNGGTVTLPPTCTQAGQLTSICTQCEGIMAVTSIPAYGHTWSSLDRVQYNAAGAFVKPATCKICGETEYHTVTDITRGATTLYDWGTLLTGNNNSISEAWFGFHAAYPKANWSGVVALFRGGTDENGTSLYSYDATEKSVTLNFNGTNWQALQFNTNINNSLISDMSDADYGFMQMDIWYEAGSFPGWVLSRDDKIGYIDQNGTCWTWQTHADRSDDNRVSFGQLQAGWNTLTIIGVAQRNGLGAYEGLNFYLGLGTDASQGLSAADLADMTCMTSNVKNNFANWRNPHQVIFIVPDEGLGTVSAPTQIKLRNLKEGYLSYACPHTQTQTVAATAPTCDEVGYTEGVRCGSCGLWLSGHEKLSASHTWDDGEIIDSGSCTAPERQKYVCTVCGEFRYAEGLYRHQYAQGWSSDALYHWHTSTCGHEVVDGKALHSFGQDGVCTVCSAVSQFSTALSYTLSDGGYYEVTGRGSVTSSTVWIPALYAGSPVRGVTDNAFQNDTTLTRLIVSDGVTALGDGSFSGCENLKTVILADSVTEVASDAFEGAPIEAATLAAGILNCLPKSALREVEITSGSHIPYCAFQDVTTLESITIPFSVLTVEEYAFAGCTGLTHVYYKGTLMGWNAIDFLSSPLAGGITLTFVGGKSYTVPANLPDMSALSGDAYLQQTEHTLGSAALVNYDTAAYFPSLNSILAKGRNDVPIYGIYAWTEDYSTYYDAISKIGFTSLRTNSTSMNDDRFMKIQRQGISVMVTAGVSATGYLKEESRDKAASELTTEDYDVTAWIAANVNKILTFLNRYGPNGTFFTDTDNPYYDELHDSDGNLVYYNPVTAIEVYNEPNFQYMTGHSDPWLDVKQTLYAALQNGVYTAVKAPYPGVTIAGFGAGGASSADVGYIAQTLSGTPSAAQSMDVLSTHPYFDESSPFAGSSIYGAHSLASQLANIRATLATYGVGDLPIWYTECGWAIKHAEGGYYSSQFGTDQRTQAAMLVQEYIYGMRVGVERINYMYIMDTDNCNYGILNRDGTWRKAAYALNTLIGILPDPVITGVIGNEGKDVYGQVNQVFVYTMESAPGGPEVVVAFSALDPKTVDIPWEEECAFLTDMYGTTKLVMAHNGVITLEVGSCMQYLSHVSDTVINPVSQAE